MASATARAIFSFHNYTSHTQSSPLKPNTHLSISPSHPKKPLISLLNKPHTPQFTSNSIDVSKEDKPISEVPISESEDPNSLLTPPDYPSLEETTFEKFEKRRLEERFAVLNTGIHECKSCGYLYNEGAGDPSYPIPPGMQFDQLPEDWRCPTCGAAQSFFQSKSVEIAGFAENQQFGLGANTLTSGQKLIFIYGTLLLFFGLFLSGYFLQ
ncbi:hypothetical protein GIB67_024881 [Kingdonia uniflora]|uniref:Rubredoxin-like domain-containing protein n=1 Tax=Kingdonia uniflora TaxID=39325 RepID=A0A7J7NYK2_9MAGN|nr:hypothetical protein GIB67_024881 [Kingdonia uniflora]